MTPKEIFKASCRDALNQFKEGSLLIGQLYEASKAYAAAVNQPQWKPIETAPLDNTLVDLWVSSEGIALPFRMTNCKNYGGGWKDSNFNSISSWLNITHWMPLPEGPKEEHQEYHLSPPLV